MAWPTHQGHRRGVPAQTARRIHARDHSTCHVCGHDGADQIDHVLNWAISHDDSDSNLAPIHGAPCPTCGKHCHDDKTKVEATIGRARVSRKRATPKHPGLFAIKSGCPW